MIVEGVRLVNERTPLQLSAELFFIAAVLLNVRKLILGRGRCLK